MRRHKRWSSIYTSVVLATIPLLTAGYTEAQTSATALAERSAVVVSGTVVKVNASEEPLQTPSANTVVVKVDQMLAGAEISGDQKDRNVTVVLSRPRNLKVGTSGVFFGNPRFIGKTMTIAGEGEILTNANRVTAQLERGTQSRRDKPVRDRLAAANRVFRGKVEEVRLVATDDRNREPAGEHDPEWQVATVRVLSPIRRATENETVLVIFPASRDIVWFNSPKLKVGDELIFITHKPKEAELPLMRTSGAMPLIERQRAELVTHPSDVLPVAEQTRVVRLTKEVQ